MHTLIFLQKERQNFFIQYVEATFHQETFKFTLK